MKMKMKMSKPKILAAAGVVVALSLGGGTAMAGWRTPEAADTPAGFTLDPSGFMVNGSGCPRGTVEAVFAPNGTDLTVAFSDYTATTGPSSRATDRRKACTAALPIRVPAGFTYGVTSSTYRGYAELNDGATAYQGAKFYFQGGDSNYAENPVSPDASGNWETTDNVPTVTWAPCDTQTNLIVTSSLKFDSSRRSAESLVTMDTQDISLHSQNGPAITFGLQMKQCE